MREAAEVSPWVDWTRMAEPQTDGYDTDMTLWFAENRVGASRPRVYQRRESSVERTFCHGKVAICAPPEPGMMGADILPASLDHPHVEAGARLLARWPVAYQQFQRLIDTVYPYTDPRQSGLGKWALGSSSHSYEESFGSLCATVDDELGFAQALVYQMARQKLRALDLTVDAVFYEAYCVVYVTALDLQMIAGAQGIWESQRLLMLLARNVPRMEARLDEIQERVSADEPSEQFTAAFIEWSRRVRQSGRQTLDANGYGV